MSSPPIIRICWNTGLNEDFIVMKHTAYYLLKMNSIRSMGEITLRTRSSLLCGTCEPVTLMYRKNPFRNGL